MISDPLERLRAANPEPWCPPPPIDDMWRRIDAEGGLAERQAADGPGERASVGAWLRSLRGVVAVLSSVAVVIAVGAVVLLSHGRGTVRDESTGAARQLIARLAVLRRPQSSADLLPAGLHIRSPLTPPGTIIPQLTRLVRTLPDARLYLVVTTPSPDSIWGTRSGDQVSIVELSGPHTTETVPIPAADLSNANEVFEISPDGLGARGQRGAYSVGIVPDGVARVRWTFANKQFKPGAVLTVSVANNVAVVRALPDAPTFVLRAAWYAADGARVPTSNRALLAAQATRDAAQKAQAIRSLLRHPYHAARSLLGAFAVFDVTSRTGVRSAAGNVISNPPLASLPLEILQPPMLDRLQLDFTQVRKVTTPTGATAYVIPGARGLCLFTGHSSSPFPDGILSGGGGGSCAVSLADAEKRGIALTTGFLGTSTAYRIVPKTIHQITVRTSRGTRTTIPVPDGIYVSPTRRTR